MTRKPFAHISELKHGPVSHGPLERRQRAPQDPKISVLPQERWTTVASQKPPPSTSFAEEVRRGLTAPQRSLPCRFLYDSIGSQLFEEICELEEYYPTQAELDILETHAREIVDSGTVNSGTFNSGTFNLAARLDATIIELGCGSSRKIQALIRAGVRDDASIRYLPIDISAAAVETCATELQSLFPDGTGPRLEVVGIVGEYESGLAEARERADGALLVLWLGGSVGNFTRHDAAGFLRGVGASLAEGDRLVVGIDLRKGSEVLERAYDDSLGVTARFNLNLLARINRELGGGFDLGSFKHVACYDEKDGCVNISLESRVDQVVSIAALDLEVSFSAGERIHTEHSYKYSMGEIDLLAQASKLAVRRRWFDSERRFSLVEFGRLSDS